MGRWRCLWRKFRSLTMLHQAVRDASAEVGDRGTSRDRVAGPGTPSKAPQWCTAKPTPCHTMRCEASDRPKNRRVGSNGCLPFHLAQTVTLCCELNQLELEAPIPENMS